jgi:hypothetical protein
MDGDLGQMTREQLIAEVKRLRNGLREHRDSSEHELCWHHPALGGHCPKRPIRFLSYLNGPSLFEGVSDIENRWTYKPLARGERTHHMKKRSRGNHVIVSATT